MKKLRKSLAILAVIALCMSVFTSMATRAEEVKAVKMVLEPTRLYDGVGDFVGGFAKIKFNGKWGYINTDGVEIISPKYDSVGDFKEGIARVTLGGKVGYFNTSGKQIIGLKTYKYGHMNLAGDFKEGLAIVGYNGKLAYMNTAGKIVLVPNYRSIYAFSEGLAKVSIGNKYGYINLSGKEITLNRKKALTSSEVSAFL